MKTDRTIAPSVNLALVTNRMTTARRYNGRIPDERSECLKIDEMVASSMKLVLVANRKTKGRIYNREGT